MPFDNQSTSFPPPIFNPNKIMVIQRLKIKNFRNVPDQEIEVNGCNVLCYGDNGVGKSNLITAVHALLSAKFPPGSIRNGTEEAIIEAALADFTRDDDPTTWVPIEGTNHLMRAVIRKDKHGEQKVDIELHYPDGGADEQVTKIRGYIGQAPLQYNFVELSRNEKGKAEQVKIIRAMYPADLQEQLNRLENKIKISEKDRTETGRNRDNAWGFVKKSGIIKEDVDKYSYPNPDKDALPKFLPAPYIDVVAVSNERNEALKKNTERDGVVERRDARLAEINAIGALILEIEEHKHKLLSYNIPGGPVDPKHDKLRKVVETVWETVKGEMEITLQKCSIEVLKIQVKDLEEKNTEANKWLDETLSKDLTTYDEQIAKAGAHNGMVDKVAEYSKLLAEATSMDNEYGELDALVQTTREEFRKTALSFDLPVPGLTVEEDKVLYNGKPVDEENTSTAERMMIDAMLSIARMDKATILFMERGESLGKANYLELKGLCDANGIQLFLEQVERQDSKELRVVVECGDGDGGTSSQDADSASHV